MDRDRPLVTDLWTKSPTLTKQNPRAHLLLLRDYVQGTRQVDESAASTLLQQHSDGDPIIQTLIEWSTEQGKQQGMGLGRQEGRLEGQAAILIWIIERKFGTPSESVQKLIASADQDTLLRWTDRVLIAESIDALLHRRRLTVGGILLSCPHPIIGIGS